MLVGETLMARADIGAAVDELLGAGRSAGESHVGQVSQPGG